MLSDRTHEVINKLFFKSEAQRVVDLLEHESVNHLGQLGDDPVGLERIRFAALKLSKGSVERLNQYIQLANSDCRDLLLAAGFENNPEDHLKWYKSYF